jgi:hypothetical protein
VLQVLLPANQILHCHPSTSVLFKFWRGEANNFTNKFATWMQPTEHTLDQHLRLNPNCICAVCTLYSLHRGLANQVNIALSHLTNLRRRVNEANQANARGNQDKEQPIYIDLTRQPIYIDLTRPDLIDLINCVNNVCHSSCDFCNFRHQPICDCNPPVVVDLTQADLNNLREYHQALRQTSIQDYLTLKDSAPLN